jgi:hypothetical protein
MKKARNITICKVSSYLWFKDGDDVITPHTWQYLKKEHQSPPRREYNGYCGIGSLFSLFYVSSSAACIHHLKKAKWSKAKEITFSKKLRKYFRKWNFKKHRKRERFFKKNQRIVPEELTFKNRNSKKKGKVSEIIQQIF